ncbi:MAG: hypothetical protein ACI92Z_002057 [Paracoccaceae bacterium]
MAVAICVWNSPAYAQTLELNFSDLFERCRSSVETSLTFDSGGLRATEVEKRHERSLGAMTDQTGWSLPVSELYVVLTAWTSHDGPTRHMCDIHVKDEERLLDASEQGLLLRQFLIHQTKLIGARTHEIDRQLSPIPPIINAAFLLSESNPRGCTVNNTLAMSPDGTFFSAGSGEQGIKECEIR